MLRTRLTRKRGEKRIGEEGSVERNQRKPKKRGFMNIVGNTVVTRQEILGKEGFLKANGIAGHETQKADIAEGLED